MSPRAEPAVDSAAGRVREALRRGREDRVPGGSRGVSYAPQDLTARLRRVEALRRLCLELRRSATVPRPL